MALRPGHDRTARRLSADAVGNLFRAGRSLAGVKIILTDETEYSMAAGPPGDSVLWDRLRDGDREALGLLFDRVRRRRARVRLPAYGVVGGSGGHGADDVPQHLAALPARPTRPADRRRRARGWLLAVASERVPDAGTARRRRLRESGRTGCPIRRTQPTTTRLAVAKRLDDERQMSQPYGVQLAKLPRHEQRDARARRLGRPHPSPRPRRPSASPNGTVKARLHRTRRRFPDLLSRVALNEELS